MSATSSMAELNGASLAFDGLLKPLIFLTNWIEEARISSSVTGGSKLNKFLIFRHIQSDLGYVILQTACKTLIVLHARARCPRDSRRGRRRYLRMVSALADAATASALAMGSRQPRRMASIRSPKHSSAPAAVPIGDGTPSKLPITTTIAPASAATA